MPRLEWISVVYLALFVLAVLSPSIHTRSLLGFSETQLEELTIFIFGLAGLLTFALYERLMERREKEREEARLDFQRAQQELIESYAYIGSINRKIELLKRLANDTSTTLMDETAPKDLYQALTVNACSALGAEAALLRFVDTGKLRTEGEFIYGTRSNPSFRVANKDLRALRERGDSHAFVRSEDGKDILVVPSDKSVDGKAHFLFLLDRESIPELDVSLIKIFANQAEMLHRNFSDRMAKMAVDAQPETRHD